MGNYLMSWLSVGMLLGITMLASGQEPQPLDFLIFRNGATLAGHVVREGDWYVLTTGAKGDGRYPVTTVVKVCQSAHATYLYLKEHIQSDDPAGHCLVARFCVTWGLEQGAREEIQAALKLDRRNTDARSLLAQLENSGKKSEATIPDLPQPTVAPLPAARLEDWPRLATQLTEFSKHIQPILLNGCGTSACHGSAEGRRAFVLTRGLYGTAPSPLTSRANLERVLGLVDKEHPDESPLLKRALQMHGGAKSAPLVASDQMAYLQLQAWVATACGVKPETMAKTNQGNSNISQTGFASNELEGKSAGSSAAFAAPEQNNAGSMPSETKRDNPSAATFGSAPKQEGQRDNSKGQSSSKLPPIPGLIGKAASQLGQAPPPQPESNSSTSPGQGAMPDKKKPPPKNLKEDPEFLNYSRVLGVRPPIAGPDREPPRQIRVQNAGSFEIRTPAPPDIPEEYKRPAPAKDSGNSDDKSKEMRALNSGTIVNPPKQ